MILISSIQFANSTSNNSFQYYTEYDFDSMLKTKYQYYQSNSIYDGFVEIDNIEITIPYSSLDSNNQNGLMNSCWPMKGQNTRHTGLSPYLTIGNNGIIHWKFKVNNWIESGICIDENGLIYFGSFDNYLYSLFPNGTLKWKYKVDGWIWSTPAISEDGTLYIGTYGYSFYAINPDGSLKWKFNAKNIITSSPAISDNGLIYFGTMGSPETDGARIICMNPNGTMEWDYQTGYFIASDPAIGYDGTIYIGSGDSYLYALYPDGTLKWRYKTGDNVKSHPTIGNDGTIYFDSFDDYLYALNSDGSLKWKIPDVGCGCASVSIDNNGIIYIGGDDLTAINPNGTIRWSYTFGNNMNSHHSSPAISCDGTIFIGVSKSPSSGGYIFAFDKNGEKLWNRKIGDYDATSSPCINEDGVVFIGSASPDPTTIEAGHLYSFKRNETNQPPIPPIIHGESVGSSNNPHTLSFTSSDPDLDDIKLYVDWGDETNTGWIGPYNTREEITLEHIWAEKGTYQIRAKARDTYDGSESEWSTLNVIMPKNKMYDFPFLNHIFDWFMDFIDRFNI